MSETHYKFMQLALELADKARGYTSPNPMVGCVIIKNNQVIGSGFHQKSGCAHAEINAIADAVNHSGEENLFGATCYVTLEPCCHYGKTGPCVTEIIKHKFSVVVIAMRDPNPLVAGKSIELLKQAGINVIEGVLEEKANQLNLGFISRMVSNKPHVTSKLAMSLDGSVGLSNGESKWITNQECREDVHKWRLYSDAIVTTAATVIKDNPGLDSRIALDDETDKDYNYKKQPLRVVIDKALITNPESKIYNQDVAKTIIITSIGGFENSSLPTYAQRLDRGVQADYSDTGCRGQAAARREVNSQHPLEISKACRDTIKKIEEFESIGVKIYQLPAVKQCSGGSGNIDIAKLWQLLLELDCNDVFIEAGGNFNAYLLQNKLVDQWLVYQSGLIMGQDAQNMFAIGQQDSISGLFKLKCKQIKQFGDDWRLLLD